MIILLTISFIFNLILLSCLLSYKKNKKSKENNVSHLAKALANYRMEDDFLLDKEHDDILIDNYMNVLKNVIDNFNKSRSKQIAFRTRRLILYETIMIIPIITKYIDLNFDYDTSSKILPKRTDKDIIRALSESYNSFSKDAPEAFNDIILCVLYLGDNK